MSDLSYEQIEAEFQRQARLCSGIGAERQLEIVSQFWEGTLKRVGNGDGFDYEIHVDRVRGEET